MLKHTLDRPACRINSFHSSWPNTGVHSRRKERRRLKLSREKELEVEDGDEEKHMQKRKTKGGQESGQDRDRVSRDWNMEGREDIRANIIMCDEGERKGRNRGEEKDEEDECRP